MRRILWLTLAATLSACGTQLPAPPSVINPVQTSDAGYQELQFRLSAVDQLNLTKPQKDEAKAKLTSLAEYVNTLNNYLHGVAPVNQSNQSLSSAYSWLNGVVGGLGSLLASIDSKRNWGPAAGAIGAAWTGLGLTLQKAFVDPQLTAGTELVAKAVDVRTAVEAEDKTWQDLINAAPADQPSSYPKWTAATEVAINKAKSILGSVMANSAR